MSMKKTRVQKRTSFGGHHCIASTSVEPCDLGDAWRHVEARVLDRKLLQHRMIYEQQGGFLETTRVRQRRE